MQSTHPGFKKWEIDKFLAFFEVQNEKLKILQIGKPLQKHYEKPKTL